MPSFSSNFDLLDGPGMARREIKERDEQWKVTPRDASFKGTLPAFSHLYFLFTLFSP